MRIQLGGVRPGAPLPIFAEITSAQQDSVIRLLREFA